nr:hypothetical protein [uncultured bacterium]
MISTLYVDEKTTVREGCENLLQSGHQANPRPTERKGLATISRIAVADIEFLELGHRMLTGDTSAVGAAVQCPIMEDSKVTVGRGMNVYLDDISTRIEAGLHRGYRILQISVGWGPHT